MKSVFLFSCLALSPIMAQSTDSPSLSEQLNEFRAGFTERVSQEIQDLFQDGIDSVADMGIYERVKKTGDTAPDFTLSNHKGEEVSLAGKLEKGPVILTWYRGGWCPYCNIQLAALQQKLPEIQELGATLIALSPELPDHAMATQMENELGFEVLSDIGSKVADSYGLVFKMTEGVAAVMHEKFDTIERNGDDSDTLPLAASYVIAPSGEILYAFTDADYRERAEPERLVDALKVWKSGPDARHSLLQFWEGVWNPPYDIDLVDRLMTEDFVITSAGVDTEGRDAFKDWIRGFQSKVGDLRITNQDVFVSELGDRVVSRWEVRGKNLGMFGTEKTKEPISFTGIAVWEWRDGKLAHNWVERSAYELSKKLTGD